MKYIVEVAYYRFMFHDRYDAMNFAETALITGDSVSVSINLKMEKEDKVTEQEEEK